MSNMDESVSKLLEESATHLLKSKEASHSYKKEASLFYDSQGMLTLRSRINKGQNPDESPLSANASINSEL